MPNTQLHWSGTYSSWLGKSVVLHVTAGQLQTVLPCTVIGESDAALRIRIGEIFDIDIYKDMILGVERDLLRSRRPPNMSTTAGSKLPTFA
jgi:hypothetical protein